MNNCGKTMAAGKGFVFSIDAALAAFLLMLVLITITFLSTQADRDALGGVQMSRVGKDALYALDRQGNLQTFDNATISASLLGILQENLQMRILVQTYYHDNGSFFLYAENEYGEPLPNGTAIYGARRDFLAIKGKQVSNYSIARAYIWHD